MLLSTIQSMNVQMGATILMVTHDAFTASYANRILFLQDGKIFTELIKGTDSRRTFFDRILNVLTMFGGKNSHVCQACLAQRKTFCQGLADLYCHSDHMCYAFLWIFIHFQQILYSRYRSGIQPDYAER